MCVSLTLRRRYSDEDQGSDEDGLGHVQVQEVLLNIKGIRSEAS